MSNKLFKYSKLYSILKESIDWENAQIYSLKLNSKTNFELEGFNVGMMIENIPESEKNIFGIGSILYNKFNPKTFFNFGFDINEKTDQQYKSNYKILSKILGITVKSLFKWLELNKDKVEVLIVFASGGNERERKKKLSIYGSILQGNEKYLKSIGYRFDGNMGVKYLTISKNK